MLETLLAELLVLERVISTNQQLVNVTLFITEDYFSVHARTSPVRVVGHKCQTRANSDVESRIKG